MIRIDFMGTPGIGKTYLIENLLNHPHLKYQFLSRRDALVQIAKKNVSEYAFVYKVIMQIGLYLPLGDAALLLANMINRKKEEEIFAMLPSINQIIDQALLQYREFSQPALRKIKRVQGLYQQIIDGVLISLDPKKNIVLMDESLAQHLPNVAFDSLNSEPLFPHILVHVTGSVDDLVAHIRDREIQRKRAPRKLDHSYLQESLDYYTERANKFSAAGVLVVKVDIGFEVADNIKKILTAIETLPFSNIESVKIEN